MSTLGNDIASVFAAILAVCDAQGLIGREMSTIDSVKLPGNASKHRSGTRADFERPAEKLEAAATTMRQRHRAADTAPTEPDPDTKASTRIAKLEHDAAQIRTWLARNPQERRGAKGAIRKSNRSDNESAKMAASKGVLQGCTGVAAVDAAHQIMVDAQAHGTGSEQELLLPVVTADTEMRRRDERFATQDRYTPLPNPLHDKSKPTVTANPFFTPTDSRHDPDARTRRCPAGKSLFRKGRANMTKDYVGEPFRDAKRDCVPCSLRTLCLRTPDTTPVRKIAFVRGRVDADGETHTARMKARIDAPLGREQYGRRFATVEPVFVNVRRNKRLDRFTLRGREKVDAQWRLCCLVHHIEKLAKAGYAA